MNWPQKYKFQCRKTRNTKKQGNMTPPKVNYSIIMDSNDNEVDEISDNRFKGMTIRMINEVREHE
jgi:hypothetical protein